MFPGKISPGAKASEQNLQPKADAPLPFLQAAILRPKCNPVLGFAVIEGVVLARPAKLLALQVPELSNGAVAEGVDFRDASWEAGLRGVSGGGGGWGDGLGDGLGDGRGEAKAGGGEGEESTLDAVLRSISIERVLGKCWIVVVFRAGVSRGVSGVDQDVGQG